MFNRNRNKKIKVDRTDVRNKKIENDTKKRKPTKSVPEKIPGRTIAKRIKTLEINVLDAYT